MLRMYFGENTLNKTGILTGFFLFDLYLYIIMSIIRLAFELFILYLLYKLVFELIIPVAKTTKQVKKQFGDLSSQLQEKMNQQQAQQKANAFTATKTPDKPASKKDDYIDFEEVK